MQDDTNTSGVICDRSACKNVVVGDKAWVAMLQGELGHVIATARKAKKMSAVRLSEEVAQIGVPIHRVAVTRIEKGEQAPTISELVAIAIALQEDWIQWIITATNGMHVGEVLIAYSDWRSSLGEIEAQLNAAQDSLKQIEWSLTYLRMPDHLRALREGDKARYQETIESLQTQQKEFLRLLNEGGYLNPENKDTTDPLAHIFDPDGGTDDK